MKSQWLMVEKQVHDISLTMVSQACTVVMVFVFSPHYFLLSAQIMSKVICVPNNFRHGVLYLFFFLSLNSRDSIAIIPVYVKLGIGTDFIQS